MAKTSYTVKEFTPALNQKGVHSYYAEAVINQTLSMQDIAERIGKNTGFKMFEAQAMLAAFVEELTQELLEGNAVQLADAYGNTVVKFQPSVKGSMSDEEIKTITTAQHAKDSTIAIRTVAQESDVTTDRLSWTIAAHVMPNFSKYFADHKQAQKVKVSKTEVTSTTPSGNQQQDENNEVPL